MPDIASTLTPAQRAILDRLERQPGFFELAFGLFRGGAAWATLAMMVAEIGLFAAGVWCGWRFLQAAEPMEALRFGLPALGLILMSFTIKFSFWPVMHVNRLKRQVAELELRLAGEGR
ncbi:MAG TPA: DUF6768 family protein [Brevundimonas sp.]|jgi:hypothetical protein|uniref:DUF6768 family protein n=1 Tax=Brevundimonas sp. TaxID=1871086 RepID=UPI002E139AE7|nr:DUF6768 family protein [Brevundimonas sp.]